MTTLRNFFGFLVHRQWLDSGMIFSSLTRSILVFLWNWLFFFDTGSADFAPLRLVSWVSCEVPARVQQVLHQLMTLFGEVAPVSSDEVLEIGRQQLGVTASGELSWDMIRDALIREVTFGGTTCPKVCYLMAAFLQRLPLPRLVHFLDMILPQMVPVQSPCHSGRRRFASSYRVAERLAGGERGVEYTLNVIKLFWSRSGIMHVAIAWDHKPLLLLATALLPNRTTESFESEAGPPYDKQRIQMVQSLSVSGVELATTKVYWLLLPLTCILTSRGKDSISFGSMSTFLTVRCTTCREVSLISGIPWCSKTFIILEIPKVLRNWRSSFACPVKGWGCAVGSSALTACIPMDRASARSSSLQLLNCCGLQLELKLFSVKMKHNGHYMQPSCHFSALRTDMSWLPWVLLYWPCVKGVQD